MPDFDPYYEWLGIPPRDQPPHAYRLLGVELFESNAKVIESAAEQRILLLRSRAGGKQGELSQALLNEVSKAQILLLTPAKKQQYDAELKAKLGSVPKVAHGTNAAPGEPAEGLPLPLLVGGAAGLLVVIVGAILFLNSSAPSQPPEKDPPQVAGTNPGTNPAKPPTPSAPTPSAPTPAPLVKAEQPVLVSARFGVEDKWNDVAKVVAKHFAESPFVAIAADRRTMGDPADRKIKNLEIVYTVAGQRHSLAVEESRVAVVPPLPDDGVALPDAAQEFRVVAARYGAGVTWIDVSPMVRQRVTMPGEQTFWSAFTWNDPWHGVPKHVAVWFDFQGKRYCRVFREGDSGSLLPNGPAPRPPQFAAEIVEARWSFETKVPARLAPNDRAFGLLSQVAGDFRHPDAVRLALDGSGHWQVEGETKQALAGHGLGVITPLRDKFERETERYHWKPGMPPVKMIHSSEGFCVLAGVGGYFAGGGEGAWVTINPQDGFWYLECLAVNKAIHADALAYRLKPNSGVKLRCIEFAARRFQFKILPKTHGFCYLSGMLDSFRGYGEQARVFQNDQGDWELHAKNCSAKAFAILME